MRPALMLRAVLLEADTRQGVVTAAAGDSVVVSTAGGAQRVAADIPVVVGDLVTVRGGRIVSKRTGGERGAVKVYQV